MALHYALQMAALRSHAATSPRPATTRGTDATPGQRSMLTRRDEATITPPVAAPFV